MTKELIKDLRSVGFKQNESEVYLYLLQNGLSTPPQISKGTSIARTNCYNILNSLLEKGVIDEKLKGKKKVYLARDPKSIKLSMERKIESIERLLPDLEAIRITQKNKPMFRFYDGWLEVKNIYMLSSEAKVIHAVGSTERLDTLDHAFFENYTKLCEKKHIIFHDLLTADSISSGELIKNLRGDEHVIKFLPQEYSKNITDLLIWDDNLAMISLEEPIFGTIITSSALAETMRSLLSLIWQEL